MIRLEQGMLSVEENLRIAAPTGSYEDVALVECYDAGNSSVPRGAYQAQYLKYGKIVYHFSDPKELGEAILTIDPESTHSAATYVRMTNELLAQMNGGTLEPSSLEEIRADEGVQMPEAPEPEAEVPEPEAPEEMPETPEAESPEMPALPDESATTTPAVLGEDTQATSTPAVIEDATSTPILPSDAPDATTTPEIISVLRKKKGVRRLRV